MMVACGLVRLTIPIIKSKTTTIPRTRTYQEECRTVNISIFFLGVFSLIHDIDREIQREAVNRTYSHGQRFSWRIKAESGIVSEIC